MKRKLTLLLTAFLLLSGMRSWGQLRTEASIDFSEQGFENAQDLDGVVIDIDENVTVVFNKATGNNGPKYYNTGTAIRAYGGNNFIVSSTGTISSITLTFSSGDGNNEILTEVGTFESPTWTGSESEVTFTIGGTSGHRRIKGIDVVYSSGGAPQQYVATPTFSPEAGVYFESQTVTISCETADATIHYTLDGSTPTEDSPVFSSALTIDETTTVKAKAWKAGYQPSPVATATYSITNLITIAEARALELNEYALVQGIVTFIDNRNVYVQDATAGICLFLNNNTVPAELALGDLVQAYGKRANYNGLAELSNINGGNSDEFAILSSGNTLPLVVKTIAEINEGGDDALQCIRVKIEEATIGAINPSNNTPLSQGEATINIYKVPELTGIEEGDVVDVTGVVGYFNAAQIRVALASDVVLSETPVIPDPQLTVSVSELVGFDYVYGAGPSESQSFEVSGENLTHNVTVSPSENFEVSTQSGELFQPENPVVINVPESGSISGIQIQVRLKSGLEPGTYSEQITVASEDAATLHVTVTGTVTEESPTVITIAEARALALDEYALVQGVVTFIDGRNVYIQDETAGIDLYLNNNTVPSVLTLGDMVQAYGKRAVYNGLVELSNINGNDAEQFSILSTGNTLPLVVKTIAEILEGGADALQCTRVKVESATIGAINTSGNTPLTQNEATINIYKVPALTGINEGDVVDVVAVIGYFNAAQLRVALAEDVTLIETPVITDPQLTVSVSELVGFDYIYGAGPSESQSFEVSGENMTHDVTVSPSENFEISTLSGDLFQPENPISINVPESGAFSGIQIQVRLKSGLEVGTYSEQITVASEGAETLYVTVTGTVSEEGPTPPPTPTGDYVRISDLSQLVAGSYVVFAARFDENATDYYAMSNSSSGKPTGVLFTSTTNEGQEILPASITDEENSFYWTVGVTDNGYTFTNASGELIGWSSGTNFATDGENTEWLIESATAGDAAMVPFYEGFTITNANTTRGFALNSQHNFGPYAISNNNNSGYNFYLDLFVKAGGEPPVPPTPTVATPIFTPAGGTYYEVQEVTISCATDGATIYYSTVSENGPWSAYTEAITVEETSSIWAYATKEDYNDSPVAEATYTIQLGMVTIFNQDWEGDMNGWTFVTVVGDNPWTVGQYQGNHYAYANGYNGGVNEQWCISPGFNMHDYDNVFLSFRNAKNYIGPDLELKYSTNYDGGDPTAATWWTFDFNMSPGSYTWVESGDIHISITPYPAHDCYIAFKYTSTENEAAAWEVDDIMLVGTTSVPNITATPNSLSGFTHVVGEGPSESQYFTLSGVNIGPAPGGGSTGSILMQVSGNAFEISLDNETFSWQQSIDSINGTLPPTPVYVRLNGSEVGQYTATVEIYASSSDETTVTLSGTVTEPPVPGGDYVRISDVSQLADGNRVILASRYNETSNAYYALTNTLTSGHLSTVEFTSVMDGTDEIIPESLVNTESDYYWTVGITSDGYTFTNANGDMIGYGTSGTNFVLNGERTVWTAASGVSTPESLVPEYYGFNIINATTDTRAFALRVTETESIVKAYSTSNMTNSNAGEYNFFLDIFMQGEGGEPPTPTVAAPTFSPAAGIYYVTQDVIINCTTTDATIYYSLDSGNGPWEEYEEAITVDENMTIWAYATKTGYNDSPIVSAEYIIQNDLVIIFNQDWEDDWNGWTEVCVEGDSLWRIASYQGNHYAYANGYNHPATEDWLISPAFDLDSYDDVTLSFRTAMNYTGPDLELFFSNDYDGQDPTAATWQSLDFEPSQGGWNWVETSISLDGFSGSNCYIGFKYTCTDEDASGWEVDDIKLASGSTSPTPTLIATPNYLGGFSYVVGNGPSASQSYILSGVNLEDEGEITIVSCSFYEISNDNETFGGVLTFPCTDLPATIYVRMMEGLAPYTYDGVYILNTYAYENDYVYVEVNVSGIVHYEYEPTMSALMPHYIQGNNGSNNNRVPMATPVQFANLQPNTTYRYTNQFVDDNDGPETAGAGNVIYANPEGFYRSTSPSLATEGGYGEFTTDEEGHAMVWLMNEPTANTRFTPGNHVYLRVRLNDGGDGTMPAYFFTSEDYATVLNFGTENDEYSGSAFYVKSDEAPMSFAMMFATYDDLRPVYSTSIETIGVDYGSINQYASFYKEEVAGNDGWFGGILPNNNENGINIIWILDMENDVISDYYTMGGEWYPEANTINPTNGLDEPIFIDLTYDGFEEQEVEANIKVWSADHEFVIENGDNAHFNMTVYNILGQPMMTRQINAGSTEHISHSLASGIYVISLQNNQNSVSVKVIVK